MTRPAPLRRLARCAVLAALVALVVPGASVRPASISLTTVERASAVDFGDDDVVWILVLGSDAKGSTPVDKGNTDAIQLLGFDVDNGVGGRHRHPARLVGRAPATGSPASTRRWPRAVPSWPPRRWRTWSASRPTWCW